MLREYLKLARSFNAVLTGISPMMGAIAMEQYDIVFLILLFLVGFLGHTYGFVLNDIIDFKIDKDSKEIRDRPLVSGTIPINKARVFAVLSMFAAFIIAAYICISTSNYFPFIVLIISAFFISLYDFVSKKFPVTDIFVALGIFFLILYGALTVEGNIQNITLLAWFVCLLGSIQVLFMQMIAGGMKDIENDFEKGAHTLAIALGVRVQGGKLFVSNNFKALAAIIQLIDIGLIYLAFILIDQLRSDSLFFYIQILVIALIGIIMFILSFKLLTMKRFERVRARAYIGVHYMTNFMLVPVMLMSLNVWVGLLMFFPFIGFIMSNLVLHGTFLQPKTM